MKAVKEASLAAKKAESMQRMMADLKVDRAQNPAAFANDRWEDEGDEEEDVDVDLNDPDIIDRSTLLRLLSHSWTALTVSVDDVPLPGEEGRDYIDITQLPSNRGESSIKWKRPG